MIRMTDGSAALEAALSAVRAAIEPVLTGGTLAERVAALNAIRRTVGETSPFAGERVVTTRASG